MKGEGQKGKQGVTRKVCSRCQAEYYGAINSLFCPAAECQATRKERQRAYLEKYRSTLPEERFKPHFKKCEACGTKFLATHGHSKMCKEKECLKARSKAHRERFFARHPHRASYQKKPKWENPPPPIIPFLSNPQTLEQVDPNLRQKITESWINETFTETDQVELIFKESQSLRGWTSPYNRLERDYTGGYASHFIHRRQRTA